ncbi:unnamed protein product [Rhizophagus irregularis]|nr:unnamed protein product [Rhizophagus irregularis]
MIYTYDEITDEDWLKYKKETTKLLDIESQPISRNVNDLNRKKKSNHFKESKSYQHMCFIRNLRRKLKRISKTQKEGSFNINHMSKSQAFFTKSESVKKIVLNNRQKTTLTNIMDEVKLASTVLTDPQLIKKEVNNHFQQIAGSTGIWIDQYFPRDYVNANVYDGLMDHITQKEIEYHISLLAEWKGIRSIKSIV